MNLRCLGDSCGERLELGLEFQELAELLPKEPQNGLFRIPVGEEVYLFRKPTGNDLFEWMQTARDDQVEIRKHMVKALISGEDLPHLDEETLDAIDEEMKKIDPLVHFQMTVFCPACNKQNVYILDLEELALAKLEKVQADLLDTIHRLASRYHWSEEAILAMGPRRRARYLGLIEKEEVL